MSSDELNAIIAPAEALAESIEEGKILGFIAAIPNFLRYFPLAEVEANITEM